MLDSHQELSVLASGCAVTGHASGRDLNVLGHFDGDVDLSGRMHVASGARVKGRVRASVVEIDGHFEGEVRAGTLRLGVGASAHGLFFADRLAIVEGARLEGDVNPVEPPAAKPVPAPVAMAVAVAVPVPATVAGSPAAPVPAKVAKG
jgi:cytoskeletal protein CcmA (bactofilin family)